MVFYLCVVACARGGIQEGRHRHRISARPKIELPKNQPKKKEGVGVFHLHPDRQCSLRNGQHSKHAAYTQHLAPHTMKRRMVDIEG